jgi:N-acetylglucosaminyldiphosphoundecaprenol N-acetyl-beta-D-mannosaminyltransferase
MSSSIAAGRDTAYATVPLMGLDIAAISELETIDHVLDSVADQQGGWLCTANLDILRQWHASTEMRDLIACADLVVADGMPLIWAGGLQGSPLPERVAGSTLVVSLTAAAARVGASVFLLGGNPGIAESAAAKLTELNPNVRLVGTLCPPFGFENDREYLNYIVAEIEKAQPDIVYVGLGFPKQERLIAVLRDHLHNTWFISCGVSFSFVAGEFRRAPILVQRLGLEWLHRLAQEPHRLFRRYLIDGLPFLVELMWSAITFRMRASRASS